MEERRFHPLDYLSVLQRRKWWFIVPMALSVVVGLALVLFLPREYKSQAEIGIADPTLSPELLRGVQSFDAQERQRAVSQQLLSATVLERVVREEKIRPDQPVEETAGAMRARVEDNIVVPKPIGRTGDGREGIESFRLGYVDSSPERAQRIANRLAMVFVEENSKTKTQRAENTSEVLAQQLRNSQENLSRLQEQLRIRKQANMGRLPDQMNANISMVNGLRQQHDSLSLQLRAEQDRLSMIEGQIESMKQGSGGVTMTSTGAAAMQAAQNRINELQRQLTQYRAAGYTDQHPDIVQTKEELTVAQRDLTSARQQPSAGNADVLGADPAYRQKVQERDAAKLHIAQLQRQVAQALSQIGSYQARVESAPLVEQELSSLVQDYELERTRYTDLSAQHQKAMLAEDLARKQGGERFVVLNPASLPTSPDSPDLLKLMLLSLGMGFMLGTVAVVGREFMDRSVHDARVLQNEFDVPVLGEIPRIHAV
ncbi:MAG TPA: Wzz/FepE/Etk N-terminal domain-containing protein [Vicinamibacterales bacterium]|nr:Wzz/FepE/Etk N-terminal domain-containing protein [Vicinamibacterales bacterium]